jgi:hypothetical protein
VLIETTIGKKLFFAFLGRWNVGGRGLCRTISLRELLMKSYCLSDISPSRTHTCRDRVGYIWQHLDRDQVDTPEFCSNRLWAQ